MNKPKLKIQPNKYYYIKLNHYSRELEYEGKILWIQNGKFRIKTFEDLKLMFNLKQIVYVKEIPSEEAEKKKIPYNPPKINKKREFIPREKLKKPEEPEMNR